MVFRLSKRTESFMRWRDHIRITREVCKYYGLQNATEVAEASILPDRDPDYYWTYDGGWRQKRVPHHDEKAVEWAFRYLKKARKSWKAGQPFAEYLGRALHYLQDYSVDPTENLWVFSYRSDEAHEARELDLQSQPVNHHAIERGASQRCYPHEFKGAVQAAGKGRTAEEIMWISTYLTSLALKLVFNPDRPENLEVRYRKALVMHIILIAIPWILILALNLFSSSTLIWSTIGSYVIHKLDFHYSRWRTNHEWF